MNRFRASSPSRGNAPGSRHVPVVLPLVEVDVDDTGMINVRLDREPYRSSEALYREDLSSALDAITIDLGTPARVEIREPDGSRFTDIVTPPQAVPESRSEVTPEFRPELFGGGFIPGEKIAVAVVVAHQLAAADGTAQFRLPAAMMADRPGVVLLGRSSGTLIVDEGTS